MNKYPHATAQYCLIIFLQVKFMVKQHIEPGAHRLTQSVLRVLLSLIPPTYHCADSHQPCSSLFHCTLCLQNTSGNIWCGTHNPVLWAFQSLDAIAWLYIGFILCLAVLFAVVWIIHVTIPVSAIFDVGKSFRCTIVITFGWMAVDSFVSAHAELLSSSSREVLFRQSLWHRWSVWECKCSRTISFEVRTGCFEDLFGNWNGSYGCPLLVLSAGLLLCST